MIRVPVRPPASPVATTGTSRILSARATLMPFPPASVSTSLERWRKPIWNTGTVSVRSSAAFVVTVTITTRSPRRSPPSVWRTTGPSRGNRRRRRSRPRRGSTTRRDDSRRRPRHGRRSGSVATGSANVVGATTRSTSGFPLRSMRTIERGATRSTSGCPYPVSAVTYARPASITWTRRYWSRPYSRSSRSASFRVPRASLPSTVPYTVTPDLAAAAACDQPASTRVPGLPADERRPGHEQVVGGREGPAAGQGDGRARERITDERHAERVAHERRRVTRARDVPALVQAVRVLEVRVGEPELLGFRIHETDEAIGRSAPDVKRESLCRVVRARDERRADEVRHAELLAGTQVDRRLADTRGARAHAHDVGEPRLLERDDGGHQLRDAGHRARAAGLAARQHRAVLSHEVPRGRRDLRLGTLGVGAHRGRRAPRGRGERRR